MDVSVTEKHKQIYKHINYTTQKHKHTHFLLKNHMKNKKTSWQLTKLYQENMNGKANHYINNIKG